MKIVKSMALILPFLFFAACSKYSMNNQKKSAETAHIIELLMGPQKLNVIMTGKLTLNNVHEFFRDDFDVNSRKYNPKTQCYEYRAHIYPSLNTPVLLGFDKSNKCVYFIETASPNKEANGKIVWIEGLKKKILKKISEK